MKIEASPAEHRLATTNPRELVDLAEVRSSATALRANLEQPRKLERGSQVACGIEQRLDLWAEVAEAAGDRSVMWLVCGWAHEQR